MGALVATARRQTGVTLVEMVTVVAILAVAASLAIPTTDPNADLAAEAMAAEVARAMRFAQREAIRTGTYQQVSMDPATQMLRVYQPNQPKLPASITATHPVDKRLYEISFAGNAMRATIVSSVFKYDKKPSAIYASFASDGSPAEVDPKSSSFPLKEEGRITIRYGNAERVIRVAPVTGRVTF